MEHQSQSISDILLRIMPSIVPELQLQREPDVNPIAAKSLYGIWKNKNNRISTKLYRRPVTVSNYELQIMKESNLVKENGDNLEITDKGTEVIKVMVLGDDSSSFDKISKREVDYEKALKSSNVRNANKRLSLNKTAASAWWSRFE